MALELYAVLTVIFLILIISSLIVSSRNKIINKQTLEKIKDVTYFNADDIRSLFRIFKNLSENSNCSAEQTRISPEQFYQLPEIENNPFKEDLVRIFNTDTEKKDRPGGPWLSFYDFVDMMNVLSERAPAELKAEYAFRLYDMNGDGKITEDDVEKVVEKLVGCENDDEKIQSQKTVLKEKNKLLTNNLFSEIDVDNDGEIELNEFKNVISKYARFQDHFKLRILK